MELTEVLFKKFGYTAFRPGQQEVIEAVMRGEDVLALLPTGMGKSLCYQLPAYLLDGPVLIISPLLSLMQDQVDQLKSFGEKRVIAFNSFLSHEQKQYALHFLNEYRFIFASPEMLAQPNFREKFKDIQFSLIVVDEAHCISQWGYDFRPDYLRLKDFVQAMKKAPILALTATATTEVIKDIEIYLQLQHPFRSIHSVDRPNIKMVKKAFPSRADKKEWILKHLLTTSGPGIVYMQSRNRANELSTELTSMGMQVAAYHAGLENDDRQFIQQQFLNGELEWVIATNAFGMGVHKNDIRQVIHESMPNTMANYMQEIGRAGRDGEQSVATLLYSPGDEDTAMFIAVEDIPSDEQLYAFTALDNTKFDPKHHFAENRITETMYRVLNYWLSVENLGNVKLRLQQIRQNKINQVQEMVKLLNNDECIREQIVHYFGQNLEEKLEVCCSNCGIEESVYDPRVLKEPEVESLQWIKRLQSLLS